MDYETYRRKHFRDPPPEPRFPFSGSFGVTLYFEDFDAAVEFEDANDLGLAWSQSWVMTLENPEEAKDEK